MNLEDGDDNHRGADADQETREIGRFQGMGQSEQNASGRCDQEPAEVDFADTDAIHQDAYGYLHQGVGVIIHGGQIPQSH